MINEDGKYILLVAYKNIGEKKEDLLTFYFDGRDEAEAMGELMETHLEGFMFWRINFTTTNRREK